MRARLFARTGELAGSEFEIGSEATVGRLADNQVVLPGGLVSARHSRIFLDPGDGCYRVEDLGSRNGTFLAGTRIREPEKLGRLDVINFAGAFDFIFQVLEEGPLTPVPSPIPSPPPGEGRPLPQGTLVDREGIALPASLAAAPAAGGTLVDKEGVALPPVLSGGPGSGTRAGQPDDDWVLPVPAPAPAPRFALRVETEGGPKTFELSPGENLLGRGDDCTVAIDDHSLSRKHARLVVEGERVSVIDLGSTNQTFLSGRRVFPDAVIPVEPGAELLFGGVKATLVRS